MAEKSSDATASARKVWQFIIQCCIFLPLTYINMQLILFIYLFGTQRIKSFFAVFHVYYLFKFHQSFARVRKAGSDTDIGFKHTNPVPQIREADFVLPN